MTCTVVPTATLAEHLRHQRARAVAVARPDEVMTLARFARRMAPRAALLSNAMLQVMVEDALRRLSPAEFQAVSDAPGFSGQVARTIETLDAAGCRSALEAPGLNAIWADVREQMATRELVMRSGLLRMAEAGVCEAKRVIFRGFHVFSDPELRFLHGLRRQMDVIVEERPVRQVSRAVKFAAETAEDESVEIARRILEQAARGRSFREMGVAVRNPEAYGRVLATTFERFGIPVRFYFGSPLMENGATLYLARTVEALLHGWEHEAALGALGLLPRTASMDKFEFAVREKLPGQGLDSLVDLARGQRLHWLLGEWGRMDAWRGRRLSAEGWARNLAGMRGLFRPESVEMGEGWDRVAIHRGQAEALDLWEACVEEAAEWWRGGEAISLEEFWAVAKVALAATGLQSRDERRNVVHVMSAHEAREWDLGVLFVCGLAEKEFPRRHPQNAFLPDQATRRMQNAGVLLETAADRDAAEADVFAAVCRSARELLVLSYASEEQNAASAFWEGSEGEVEETVRVRPAPLREAQRWLPPSAIVSPDLLKHLGERTAKPSVTGLESYLQCAFQYFAGKTMKLQEAPLRPENRLNFLQQGEVVHRALALRYSTGQALEPLFQEVFTEACRVLRIPESYRREMLRSRMMADLRRFEADRKWPAGNSVVVETELEIPLEDGVAVRAKMDRLETLADGRVAVVDYKYSNAKNTRSKVDDDTKLQGPLYVYGAAQAGHQVAAMVYCSLKRDTKNVEPMLYGWGSVPGLAVKLEPLTPEWVETGISESRRAVTEIRGGRVVPFPAKLANCRFCDFKDACRYEAAETMTMGMGE